MTKFNIHTIESAPEGSKPILEQLKKQVGFLPNLAATMAESPALLEAFTTLRKINSQTSLTPIEREAVAITVSFNNNCTYCVAAHSTFAKMNGIQEDDLNKLRAGQAPTDPRLQALTTLAQQLVSKRGFLSEEDLKAFLEAGFTPAQALEVLVTVSMTTIANYTHNITGVPVDDAFQPQAWKARSA
jgi:uncharacterized peroxidase-related enzyme